MRKWIFVALLVVGATVLGATVLRAPIAEAGPSVSASIINPLDGQGNVKVHEQGTAKVRVSGTQTVRETSTPFQQFFATVIDPGAPEKCDDIIVPAGMRLTIESITAEAVLPTGTPAIYLKTTASAGATEFVRSLALDMTFRAQIQRWTGDAQTLMHSGAANDPDQRTYSYSMYAAGDSSGVMRGFLSGVLTPTS